ncbi:MAG: glycosyltransferase family 4 protein [Anaerolineaceae bacterium]
MTEKSRKQTKRFCMVGVTNYFGDARVRGYAEWLVKAGHAVDMISIHSYRSNKMVEQNGVRVYMVSAPQQKRNRVSYLFDYALSFLRLCFVLNRLYIKNRYDIIHVHNMPDFIVFAAILPKLFGSRIILDIHDPMPEAYLSKFPQKEKGFLYRIIKLEEYLSCQFAHAVITANPHFTHNLIQRGIPAARMTTLLNFPDLNFFNPSKRPAEKTNSGDHFTLIFPGTIAPRYGLDVAIKAMPILKDKIPNIHLLIIGYQVDYVNRLVALAEELGVSDNVEFRPSIANDQVPQQLVRADVGIYPALPDCHMSIAIPGKVLEYALMGLPILSSRLQIVEEMFDENSVLFFEPGNAGQMAQGVLNLYADAQLRETLVRCADDRVAQMHTWEQEMGRYLDLIGRLYRRR